MANQPDLLNQLRIERKAAAKRRFPRWLIPVLVIVALIGAMMVFNARKPVPVETSVARSAAESGPVSLLDASGFVTARRIATVSSKVTGKVREVLIEEGQRVAEGEILATLDDTDAQASMNLSMAQKRAAEAALSELRVNLKQAERELDRKSVV